MVRVIYYKRKCQEIQVLSSPSYNYEIQHKAVYEIDSNKRIKINISDQTVAFSWRIYIAQQAQ